MNQYTIELIYEPIYFLIMIIGMNFVFKLYNKSLITQLIVYSVLGIMICISMLFIKMNKSKLEKEQIHYSKISSKLFVIVIVSMCMFLYYFLN